MRYEVRGIATYQETERVGGGTGRRAAIVLLQEPDETWSVRRFLDCPSGLRSLHGCIVTRSEDIARDVGGGLVEELLKDGWVRAPAQDAAARSAVELLLADEDLQAAA